MPSRASRSKSHLGCRPCKQRHLKCDEKYPVCGRCSKAQRQCSFLEDAGPLIMAPQPTPPLPPPPATPTVLPLDSLDLGLLDHYTRRTGFEFAYRPELVPLMQAMAPHLAHTRPFLMHSILALSGYHQLADDSVDPPSVDPLHSRVLYHQARAVSLYVQGMNQARSEEDGVAIRIVCILLPLISLASYRPSSQKLPPPPPQQQPQTSLPSPAASTSTTDTDDPPPSTNAIDKVVELFRLLRGSSVLFGVHEELLGTPLDVILLILDFDDSSPADPDAEAAVTRLADALPLPHEDNSGTSSPRHNRALGDDAAMYALAAKGLRRMFRVLSRAPDDMALVLGWMNGDALTAFIRLLQARSREALLVLAHWAVALHRWRHKWWLRYGLGQAVVREVWALLLVKREDADRELMQWPASQVGLTLE